MAGPDQESATGRPVRIAFDSLLSAAPARRSDDLVDLWSQLPRELAILFRPTAQDLAQEILREIRLTIPALAKPVESAAGKSIVEGIQQAILQFVDRLADPTAPQADRAQLFRDLGLHEIYEGPILDVLQMAYRVGARVAWRHMARVGERAGVPTTTLCLLAEAIFAYIDELSALSIEGHASAQARAVGIVERRRRQLLELLLSAAGDAKQLPSRRLADAAKWPVPPRVVAVAIDLDEDPAEYPAAQFDPRILVDLEGQEPCLLAAEEHQDAFKDLPTDLPGWRAAVGPAVDATDAGESLRWARRTLALVDRGILPAAQVTWFDNHMSSLWLLNDPLLVAEIIERALAPMAKLTTKQRRKLSETLLTWLETRGSAPEIAQLLDIHPQTVRYRMRQLDRLFGSRLNNPDVRFDLEVALRAQRTHDRQDHDPDDDDED
ncbi:helix-turn-helix domain-containing protein [Alloactinosynnema sp. L-07]|uniref:PucR family transcriptional regulator n=1 Tax=Alloactinosynnema sp. L-07 TaxID=1653480 RepID=UPI000AA9A2BE|nr:helix-turn-helix domain-containing protein [Alloactinosynnema sp. L-07]